MEESYACDCERQKVRANFTRSQTKAVGDERDLNNIETQHSWIKMLDEAVKAKVHVNQIEFFVDLGKAHHAPDSTNKLEVR